MVAAGEGWLAASRPELPALAVRRLCVAASSVLGSCCLLLFAVARTPLGAMAAYCTYAGVAQSLAYSAL